ncbi:MAG: peptide chain release factor N(5)-glutamine methyltransferase, partial [Burkholderiales bacterium]|nr:peptide chain release factor N(5)-glutamine methyltransferase [Burkholderiales bacterium]
VVDLGTGSGAIALAIQHVRRDARVVAVDASADALAVAQANADRLQLPVQCVQGSWLTPVRSGGDSISAGTQAGETSGDASPRFDLIVSNPPYIAEGDAHLPALVHEPIEALTSGPDGLDDIRLIVAQSPACLRPGGWLLLEHGHDQAEAVAALLCRQGFVNVQSRKDLAGIARCTGGQWEPRHEEG